MNIRKLSLILLACLCFCIPFLWMPNGFMDLGGDSGRLYFLDPATIVNRILSQQTVEGTLMFAQLPYVIVLAVIKQIIPSTTDLIRLEQGIQLALSFLSIYWIIKEILSKSKYAEQKTLHLAGILAGLSYCALLSSAAWVISLDTFNQVFLNPFLFWLLLKLFTTKKWRYLYGFLLTTLVFSTNFGFTAAPQIFAFYPLALGFLFLLMKFVYHQPFAWKQTLILVVCFVGLHAFHIVPVATSIFDRSTPVNRQIFSESSKLNAGLHYFDVNRQNFGKISNNLFQPNNFDKSSPFIVVFPLIIMFGFLLMKSRLLVLTAGFFLTTLYLVSANITLIGVRIYRQLFYLPGFLMFRSFYEKWYFVFVFFYALLIGFAYYGVIRKRNYRLAMLLTVFVLFGVLLRTLPFIQGKQFQNEIYQTKRVKQIFDLDPTILPAITYVRDLPDDGKVLTAPITEAYFQIIPGKTEGAYIGISAVRQFTHKKDISGFWLFGPHQKAALEIYESGDLNRLSQLLSLYGVRYLFQNTDPKLPELFPEFPFHSFQDNQTNINRKSPEFYQQLAATLEATELFSKGNYAISRFEEKFIRPMIYIPEYFYTNLDDVLANNNFRSVYLDKNSCEQYQLCNRTFETQPMVTFTRRSATEYQFTISNIQQGNIPLVFAEDFHQGWKMYLNQSEGSEIKDHLLVNDMSNLFLIDSNQLGGATEIEGVIVSTISKFYRIGLMISMGTVIILVSWPILRYINKRS